MATKYTLRIYPQGMFRQVFRTLEICGEDTLDDLGIDILDAFEFDFDHLYEFSMNGRLYDDDNYVFMPEDMEDEEEKSTDIPLDELGLKKGSKFLFHYDFGADWVFPIAVMKVEEIEQRCDSEVINAKGSIEQYPGSDDEE